jgi:hypothetical protein
MLKAKKTVVAGIAAAVVLGSATAAYAYVTTSGHGGSTATVNNPAFSMTVTPATISNLTPGAAATALPVTVKNTSATRIQINTIVLSFPATESCGGTITLTQPSVTTVVLDANASATFNGGTLSMADSATVDQTTCLTTASTVSINASVNGG